MPHDIMAMLHEEKWTWGFHLAFWVLIILCAVVVVFLIRQYLFSYSKRT